MANWKFIVEASMGYKSTPMNRSELDTITEQIVQKIRDTSITDKLHADYEIYDEKEGRITFTFCSDLPREKLLSLLSEIKCTSYCTTSIIDYYKTRLIETESIPCHLEIKNQNVVAKKVIKNQNPIPESTTATKKYKYSKQEIEEAITQLQDELKKIQDELKKKSGKEDDINYSMIRILERYLRLMDSGEPCSDYENKVDLIIQHNKMRSQKEHRKRIIDNENDYFSPQYSPTLPTNRFFQQKDILQRAVYELNGMIQWFCEGDDTEEDCYRANVLTKFIDAYLNGHTGMTCYKNMTKEQADALFKEANTLFPWLKE